MLFWRIWAVILGASLMVGESIRSWGQGRNLLFVLDDFFIGIPLVVTGLLMARPTWRSERSQNVAPTFDERCRCSTFTWAADNRYEVSPGPVDGDAQAALSSLNRSRSAFCQRLPLE